jgi:FkbM family methyltransferase
MLVNLFKPIVERSPRIAMTYRFVRDTWHLYSAPKRTQWGFLFLGSPLMQEGDYEPEETRLVSRIVQQADIVINVGANIGYYTCITLFHGKRVFAFEPMEANLRFLLKNVKLNGWESQVEVFPLALGESTGIIELFGGGPQASLIKGWGGRQQQFVTLVPVTTLDHLLYSRLRGSKCFIIVDIEGAELMMLKGARSFLCMEPKPAWMVEVATHENQPHGVSVNPNLLATFECFWGQGYEAWEVGDTLRLIQPQEVKAVAHGGPDGFHSHNFLFIERGKERDWVS